MNFEINKAKVVPFSMDETEIRQNFLDWVIIGDNTPLDIAYNAKILKVKKEFYPIRIIDTDYTANWSATSIWEREEEYTENVLYVKYRYGYNNHGEPCYSTMKADDFYKNPRYGDAVDKFYKSIKKKRTVVDNVERTNGVIENRYTEKVATTENNNSNFNKWLTEIPTTTQTYFNNITNNDTEIKPLIETDEYALNIIKPNLMRKAEKECEPQVPGTRHEEFKVDSVDYNYKITITLLPVYEIKYEYDKKEYTAWFSGSKKDNVYSSDKPADKNLAAKKESIEKELEEKKTIRLKSGIIGFGVVPIITFIVMLGLGDFAIALLIAVVIYEIYYVKKNYIPKHNDVKDCESKLKAYIGNLEQKRKDVAKIVKQDNLTAEEQKAKIKEIIEK